MTVFNSYKKRFACFSFKIPPCCHMSSVISFSNKKVVYLLLGEEQYTIKSVFWGLLIAGYVDA